MIKLVVVDDDEFQLELLKGIFLADDKLIVYSTNDSKTAFDLICSVEPDIVILDIIMPKPDGIELRNILLSDPKTKDTPVIFLSASKEDRIRGLEAGCYDYILKPFRAERLLKSIRSCHIIQMLSEVKLDIEKLRSSS